MVNAQVSEVVWEIHIYTQGHPLYGTAQETVY